jgi:hypothetical protein
VADGVKKAPFTHVEKQFLLGKNCSKTAQALSLLRFCFLEKKNSNSIMPFRRVVPPSPSRFPYNLVAKIRQKLKFFRLLKSPQPLGFCNGFWQQGFSSNR